MKREKSRTLFDRSRKVMPGGVSSPVRSFLSVGGDPFVASHGEGAYLYDVDGNKMIDLVCSWGPLIHGHSHPEIRRAIEKVLKSGTSFGATTEVEVQLAEKIVQHVPSVEMIRLVNSGTEACMSALRLARAYTKKEIIIKFEGHYHGHADSFLVNAGSGLATFGTSSSAGIPKETLKDTLVLPFNNNEALEIAFKEHGSRIAGIILEVVSGNMGVVSPELSFLQNLRRLTQQSGALLIFDEVMTCFRLSMAGAQGIFPIQPDITCFGKVIGGGLPVGAYGGSRKIMEMVSPLGPMYQAGTLSGNPLGAAAGLASLELIEKEGHHFFLSLDSLTSEWISAMRAYIEKRSLPVSIAQQGSMATVFFRPSIPKNYAEAKECKLDLFNKFFWALMKEGVYYPQSQFEACFVSAAHTEKVMEQLTEKSVKALEQVFP